MQDFLTLHREVSSCGICGETTTTLVFPLEITLQEQTITYNIVQCYACGTAYRNPRPTPQLFEFLYPQDTYYSYRDGSQHLRWRLKKWVMHTSSPNGTKNYLFWQLSKMLASQVMSFVPAAQGEQRLLDIGCGGGDFLEQARSVGWQVWGVEPSPAGAQQATKRGFKVFCGRLSEADFTEKFFDFIYMSHVIEHLEDPVAELRRCCTLLKDDGKLLVETPNFDCFDKDTFGPYWVPVAVPEHFWFFSVRTLTEVLQRAGFAVESTKFNFLPHKLSDFSVMNLRTMVPDARRLGLALVPALLRALARTVLLKPWLYLAPGNRPYLGDSMTMMAKKNW